MSFMKKFRQQFEKPEGLLGSIAGMLMASVGAEKNKWTVSLLDIEKDDYVLEIGFGPGLGLHAVSKIVQEGKIVGIDYSEKMLKQAFKRNKVAIQNGQMELIQADVQNLPFFDFTFDKVFTINSIIFWDKPIVALSAIREMMSENGIIAVTVQPFTKGATEETVKELGNKISAQLKEAGFTNIKIELKQMKPVSAVCVLGKNMRYEQENII